MLRKRVISGSIILTLRTAIGIIISIVGSIIILRIFDRKTYGLYALIIYWYGFFTGWIDFGIHTYLARAKEDITDRLTGAAFTLFLVQSFIGMILIISIIGPILSLFYKEDNFYLILCLLSVCYIFRSLGRTSLGLLERDLEYKKLGMIEILSQLFYYIPAVLLSIVGLGIFALVIADLFKALFTSSMAFIFKRIRLQLIWDKVLSAKMLKYGFGITTSSGIYCLNAALVPIMVGKMAGVEAVGIIRVAQNIIGQLSSLHSIAWRISIPALGRIQNEIQKVVRVVSEAGLYQVVLVGLPLFGFMSIGYWLIPLFYSAKWEPVSLVLVLACLPSIVNVVFSFQASALYAIGKNFDQAKWSAIYTLSLWPIAFLTISRFGYIGLPLAEILVLPTYYIQHRLFRKHFGNPKYKDIFSLLGVSYITALLAWFIHIPWLSIITFITLIFIFVTANKSIRNQIFEPFLYIKNALLTNNLISKKIL